MTEKEILSVRGHIEQDTQIVIGQGGFLLVNSFYFFILFMIRNITAVLSSGLVIIFLHIPHAYAQGYQLTTQHLGNDIIATVLYSLIGIVMAGIGFKMIDWVTPGDLKKDLVKNNHLPLAVVVAAMTLGVCIIIAATLIG